MMGKRIITLSREFGSGGRFIGMEVAQKLGVKYYDKEMIGQIAEQCGIVTQEGIICLCVFRARPDGTIRRRHDL